MMTKVGFILYKEKNKMNNYTESPEKYKEIEEIDLMKNKNNILEVIT